MLPSMTPPDSLRDALRRIIFEAYTPAGRWFDIALIACILLSVAIVMADSVQSIHEAWGGWFIRLEWALTILFTLEYIARLYCARQPLGYARSAYGVIDLLSILPSYLSLLFPGMHTLLVIRLLRVMRLFRILRLARYVSQGNILLYALRQSRHKITIFLFFVLVLVTVYGSLMYLIEGGSGGFTSIPRSIYWAIVTLTTVGYGDISPQTDLGQALASLVMITGYAVLAVPTGIFSAELLSAARDSRIQKVCSDCNKVGHQADAIFCDRCGTPLPAEDPAMAKLAEQALPDPPSQSG